MLHNTCYQQQMNFAKTFSIKSQDVQMLSKFINYQKT